MFQCYDNCQQASYAMAIMANVSSMAPALGAALVKDITVTQSNHVTVSDWEGGEGAMLTGEATDRVGGAPVRATTHPVVTAC